MQAAQPPGVVLGWMPYSQRSATIAERLGFELVLLERRGRGRRWTAPFAYAVLALRTAILVIQRRPRALVLIAPPFLAPLVAVPIARWLGARTAVDVHSGAVLDRRWTGSGPLLRLAARLANTAVVTVPELRRRVRQDALVIPDPLPRVAVDRPSVEHDLVVAVCGWAPDEPIEALVASARGRPWRLVLTGRAPREMQLPDNVQLAGYLPTDAYYRLLASAGCIAVLTTRDHTLLSGMWEALALGRPIVTSDTRALRRVLRSSGKYATPTPESIAEAVAAALADEHAVEAIQATAVRLRRENDAALEHLRAALQSVVADGDHGHRGNRRPDQPPESLRADREQEKRIDEAYHQQGEQASQSGPR